jgi:hypothetical protein
MNRKVGWRNWQTSEANRILRMKETVKDIREERRASGMPSDMLQKVVMS